MVGLHWFAWQRPQNSLSGVIRSRSRGRGSAMQVGLTTAAADFIFGAGRFARLLDEMCVQHSGNAQHLRTCLPISDVLLLDVPNLCATVNLNMYCQAHLPFCWVEVILPFGHAVDQPVKFLESGS